jgi:hypothetical protein
MTTARVARETKNRNIECDCWLIAIKKESNSGCLKGQEDAGHRQHARAAAVANRDDSKKNLKKVWCFRYYIRLEFEHFLRG